MSRVFFSSESEEHNGASLEGIYLLRKHLKIILPVYFMCPRGRKRGGAPQKTGVVHHNPNAKQRVSNYEKATVH